MYVRRVIMTGVTEWNVFFPHRVSFHGEARYTGDDMMGSRGGKQDECL